MENLDHYVQGKCLEMCPKQEVEMREKAKLLHILEMVPGTEKNEFPKADRNRVVKSFSRSAAGKKINEADNLRPPSVLLKTVSYLLFDVINSDNVPWHIVCDFITDRLMAVRQDMVVQNISKAETITILQPIVRFHAYAAYRLCNENIRNFDPIINNNHLQECLKKLLYLYDALNNSCSKEGMQYLIENRPEFEALYIIFNLGNEEALRRGLVIPQIYKFKIIIIIKKYFNLSCCRTKIVTDAIELSLNFRYGNFVRICRLIKNLPTLLAAVGSLHLPTIRRKTFEIMSIAYNSKTLSFPLKKLKEILVYGSEKELSEDCKYYGITSDGDCIYFTKQSFYSSKVILKAKHEAFIEDKLSKEDIQSLIFPV